MRIENMPLDGVKLVKPDVFEDYRGTNFELYNETR
jgi:dTDP-4-dehydrorhamnose 3,5-epimerase-like enzyme